MTESIQTTSSVEKETNLRANKLQRRPKPMDWRAPLLRREVAKVGEPVQLKTSGEEAFMSSNGGLAADGFREKGEAGGRENLE